MSATSGSARPLVALESAVLAHGLPWPENLETAVGLEAAVRQEGAEPRTVGVIAGRVVVGLSEGELRRLATAPEVAKVSRRDLPVVVARGLDGATTVAATVWLAHRAGIPVVATGGIGGVHRGAPLDVSADLDELAATPAVVVCSGPKAILDLAATREVLETRGVTVLGYGCGELPAFWCRESGLAVDARCDRPEEVAAVVRARRELGLPGAVLVAVPAPEAAALAWREVEPALVRALAEAAARGLASGAVTPFVLDRLRVATGGRTVAANRALLENNARVAARVARALEGGEAG